MRLALGGGSACKRLCGYCRRSKTMYGTNGVKSTCRRQGTTAYQRIDSDHKAAPESWTCAHNRNCCSQCLWMCKMMPSVAIHVVCGRRRHRNKAGTFGWWTTPIPSAFVRLSTESFIDQTGKRRERRVSQRTKRRLSSIRVRIERSALSPPMLCRTKTLWSITKAAAAASLVS